MITIKNSNNQICDFRVHYNIDIKEEIENFRKIIYKIIQ